MCLTGCYDLPTCLSTLQGSGPTVYLAGRWPIIKFYEDRFSLSTSSTIQWDSKETSRVPIHWQKVHNVLKPRCLMYSLISPARCMRRLGVFFPLCNCVQHPFDSSWRSTQQDEAAQTAKWSAWVPRCQNSMPPGWCWARLYVWMSRLHHLGRNA